MPSFLEFRKARCKDCYRCLRECPVKAIEVRNHQAQIIDARCILCGHCTTICPQNAKIVHSELPEIQHLVANSPQVIATVAPSFISSFGLADFTPLRIALGKLGFALAQETAVGAEAVVKQYSQLLESGQFKNFITSACPSVCRLVQEYYPKALKYLAPVDSPMIAHAKILKAQYPDARIVFIGPCIAKKKEAFESHLIDGVLTFEELKSWLAQKEIELNNISTLALEQQMDHGRTANLAKIFPVNRGIIKSFPEQPCGYEYMAIDGVSRCVEALQNIDDLSGVFLELNACANGCVNGPCSLEKEGGLLKATADVRHYVNKERQAFPLSPTKTYNVDFSHQYPRLRSNSNPATEKEITEILRRTGKTKPEDELNCGACGYNTCREKAWAVFNGYADIEVCLPYMRSRAESMSYEIISHNPNGIVVLDADMNITEINNKAMEMLGIPAVNVKGRPAIDFFNPAEYMIALSEGRNAEVKRLFIPATSRYVDLSINLLHEHNLLFGIMKDITQQVTYDDRLAKVKAETLATTDDVIKKQMRVAQEIASLLGETTAETKVALLKLKQTLKQEEAQP